MNIRSRSIGLLATFVVLWLSGCSAVIDSEGAKIGNPKDFAEATHIAVMSEESVQATATAVSLQTTRTAGDISAQATAQAIANGQRQSEADKVAAQATVALSKALSEVQAQPGRAAGKYTAYLLTWAGVGVGLLVLSVGLAFGVVAWVNKRATTVYPNKQGQYPVIVRSGPGWVVFHDPARNVGPGAVYRIPTLFDAVLERLKLPAASGQYPLPNVSEPSLLAVSSQSNAIGITAAQNRWPELPAGFMARTQSVSVSGSGQVGHDAPNALPSAVQQIAMQDLLPSRVPLRGLLNGTPSQARLVLGVTARDGKVTPIYADMGSMVHILAAGASGWGKSQFLKVLAYQLATATEPCQLVLADMERTTFGVFGKSSRLMFPVVDSEQDLAAVMAELNDEMTKRKELFGQYPEIENLAGYNARADAPLLPIVTMIDEATSFLQSGQVADGLKNLVRRGRKFGLWVTAGGQSFGSKDVDSATSLQFSTRVQFRAPVKSAMQTLTDSKDAKALECPGRGILVLPGQEAIKFQAPYIPNDDIVVAFFGGQPARSMPATTEAQDDDDDLDAKIRLLAGDGLSRSEIARRLFGVSGGAAFYRVKRVIEGDEPTTTTTEDV